MPPSSPINSAPEHPRSLLALTLVPGLGPILIARLLQTFGTAESVFRSPPERLATVQRVSTRLARVIIDSATTAHARADAELAAATDLGIRVISRGTAEYPALLAQIPDPPPILYIRGQIDATHADRYPLGIVGSRDCTHYGLEQTDRFAGSLASAGITIVSGGARGIDTAAHKAALRLNGRTIAVLGCGLKHAYPQDNAPLFEQIAAGRGAVISELPLDTAPTAENFPARTRLISGLSLGVLVIEAGRKSGSLITARLAAEDHGREVFAIPGRLDSPASEGTHDLLRAGGATLTTSPADILETLHAPARHLHHGTHTARYTPLNAQSDGPAATDDLFNSQTAETKPRQQPTLAIATLSPTEQSLIEHLGAPISLEELSQRASIDVGSLRSQLTMLEIRRVVKRVGSKFVATAARP
ncbi:MAG: DNA-processing protein DprA [Phycisphaerales bacterium]|nr:DNA-processing protein DprA [Phycisphaerales bacterium]